MRELNIRTSNEKTLYYYTRLPITNEFKICRKTTNIFENSEYLYLRMYHLFDNAFNAYSYSRFMTLSDCLCRQDLLDISDYYDGKELKC